MGNLFNKTKEREKRRTLRQSATPAERLLWQQLRDRRLGGFKFRRQYGIAHYVADFCCAECHLIIELDGTSHEGEDAAEYDLNRQNYFESLGFRVVRFQNEQVYGNMVGVLETLLECCENAPHPDPLPNGERGQGAEYSPLPVEGEGLGVRVKRNANSPHPSPLPDGEREQDAEYSPLPVEGEGLGVRVKRNANSPHPSPLPDGEREMDSGSGVRV